MAMVIKEFRESRKMYFAKDTETGIMEFVGFGEFDEPTARAAFHAQIPLVFPGMTGDLPRLNFDCRTIGGGFWLATANFGPDGAPLLPGVGIAGPPTPVDPAPGENTPLGADYSFDFTGVEEHVTQSKQTTQAVKRGGGIPADTQRAIGVTKDGEVQGTTRLRPNLEWQKSVTFGSVTLAYIKMVAAMVGTTNRFPFYTFPAESLILTGGTAQTNDLFRAVCTFKFLSRPNLPIPPDTGIEICPDLIIPAKKGSEYLWVSYKNATNNNRNVQQPDAAYVEKIVDSTDFANLRIGA